MAETETTAPQAPAPDYTERAAYTVAEFITNVVPMARAVFYEEVRAGRIRVKKRGHRTYVPASEGPRYIASLPDKPATEAST